MASSNDQLGEDTLLAIEQRFAELAPQGGRWAKYVKRQDRRSGSTRSEFKVGDRVIPRGSMVDHLYILAVGTIQMVPDPGRDPGDIPPVTIFQARQDRETVELADPEPGGPKRLRKLKHLPLIGARYYVTRTPASFEYVALTDGAYYAIDSETLMDIAKANDVESDAQMLLLMREVLINSDIAHKYAPRLLRGLGGSPRDIVSDFDLLEVSEEIRGFGMSLRVSDAVSTLFEECLRLRIARAADLDIESTIAVRP